MNSKRCHIICFSPTGSSRKLAVAVAEGLDIPYTLTDVTLPGRREERLELGADEILLFAAPVYYGRVAKIATEYLAGLTGHGQPALLVVNYGNRNYDDALLELFSLARAVGFRPLAAGAFVSEHSFSTSTYPLAHGRPDAADLKFAAKFGAMASVKLVQDGEELENVPGNAPYKPYPDFHRAPVSGASCTLCGSCEKLCPVAAISMSGDEVLTDERECIVCQACVKYCPEGARADSAKGAQETREHLMPLTATRREPEVFL